MTIRQLASLVLAGLALVAWLEFAEKPTTRNLAKAVQRSLPFAGRL